MYLLSAPWASSKLVTLNIVPRFKLPMASSSVWSANLIPGRFDWTVLHILWAIARASGLAAADSGIVNSRFSSANTVGGNSKSVSDRPPEIALRREILHTGSPCASGGAFTSPVVDLMLNSLNCAPAQTRNTTWTPSFFPITNG